MSASARRGGSNRLATALVAAFALVALGCLLGGGGPALAQGCYPLTTCPTTTSTTSGPSGGASAEITLSDGSPSAGATITVHAGPGTFMAGSDGVITIRSVERQLATFRAASDGSLDQAVTIPADMPAGDHTLFAKGIDPNGNPIVLSTPITIQALTTSFTRGGTFGPNGPLARTGGLLIIPATLLGLGLVAAGVLLKRSSRRAAAAPERV
jgi:hypothetical protein